MGGKTSGTRIVLPIAGLAVVIAILGSVLWFVPQWQAAGVHTGQDGKPITDVERFEVENKARGTLIQGIAGLGSAFFFLTAYFAWRQVQVAEKNREIAEENQRIAEKTRQVAEDKQVTERFVKAAEMLADKDRLEVIVAGIYALERIAKDSPKDHWTVMEVLTLFIREKVVMDAKQRAEEMDVVQQDPSDQETLISISNAIKAALTVIGRRDRVQDGGKRLNFKGANLSWANFRGADLSYADFDGAYLTSADLSGAKLEGANFRAAGFWMADLRGADLSYADFSHAAVWSANLSRAKLNGAKLNGNFSGSELNELDLSDMDFSEIILKGVTFWETNLSRANFSGADLREVNFRKANLREADFRGASLGGANFRSAENITPSQVREANDWEQAAYDFDFAEQLGLNKDEQARKAQEWDEKHKGDRT